jgi:hypothetical protein
MNKNNNNAPNLEKNFNELESYDYILLSVETIELYEKKLKDIYRNVKSNRLIKDLMNLYPLNPYIGHIKTIRYIIENDEDINTDRLIVDMKFPKISIEGIIVYSVRKGIMDKVCNIFSNGKIVNKTLEEDIDDIHNFELFINKIFRHLFDKFDINDIPQANLMKIEECYNNCEF